jgi:hypothetical protein
MHCSPQLFSHLSASVVFAEPQTTPNGPWVQDEQNLSFSSFMTNEQLYKELQKIEHASKGKMTLEVAGTSNDGYPLYVAKFGENDPKKKRVLITSQIHGNEPLTTEAVVELMQKLSTGGNEVSKILDEVTIWFMPRINPDGTMNQYEGKQYPTRYTHQTWDPVSFGLPEGTKAPWYYNSDGSERAQNNNGWVVYGIPGFDQNRDYNPNLDFKVEDFDPETIASFLNSRDNNSNVGGLFVTPEARAVTKVFKELRPDVYLDLHHRGFNRLSEEDSRSVSIQVAAVVADPYTDPFTGKQYEVDPDV